MAITVRFNGTDIKVPGCYGPPSYWYKQFALTQFLHKLGVRWNRGV